jgi:hypothetical protein
MANHRPGVGAPSKVKSAAERRRDLTPAEQAQLDAGDAYYHHLATEEAERQIALADEFFSSPEAKALLTELDAQQQARAAALVRHNHHLACVRAEAERQTAVRARERAATREAEHDRFGVAWFHAAAERTEGRERALTDALVAPARRPTVAQPRPRERRARTARRTRVAAGASDDGPAPPGPPPRRPDHGRRDVHPRLTARPEAAAR